MFSKASVGCYLCTYITRVLKKSYCAGLGNHLNAFESVIHKNNENDLFHYLKETKLGLQSCEQTYPQFLLLIAFNVVLLGMKSFFQKYVTSCFSRNFFMCGVEL